MPAKRVLIVDDDPTLLQALTLRVASLDIEVATAGDGMAAMLEIVRARPDLLILDVNMPTGDGLSLCASLAASNTIQPLPVIILTGRTDPETIERCEQLGAHYLAKSDRVWEQLQPLLTKLLELDPPAPQPADDARPPAAPTVLVIDDDPDISRALKLRLRAYGIEVTRAFSGMQGYWTALKTQPDVVICDFTMPDGCGNYVLGRLKDHSLTRHIPVIFLTGRNRAGRHDFGLERDLLAQGAAKYLAKPVHLPELLRTLRHYIDIPRTPRKPTLA